jgi:glucokinase
VRELFATSPIDTKRIEGIGIGVPGIIDERAGTIRNASRYAVRTNYTTIRDQLEGRLNLPILIGNDATLSAYGEMCLGLDRPVQNLIYLYADMGMGLILDGHIYWGSGGSAGEVGVFMSAEEDDYLSWLKGPLFVAPGSGDLGTIAQARKLVQEGHPTAIQTLVNGELDAIDLDTIIRAAQDGDQLAREIMEHAAVRLGIRIADLVNLLNPDVVVLGGGIERTGSMLLEAVCRTVKKYAHEEAGDLVEVVPAKLGEHAVALGAACWVIREVFIQA